MKKKLFNKRGCRGKKLAIGFMAIFLCGMQPAQSVMATMHYDRRQTVASEQFESSVETFSAASAARATVNKNAMVSAITEAASLFQVRLPEELMYQSGREQSTGKKLRVLMLIMRLYAFPMG